MIQVLEKTDLLTLFQENKLDGIAHQTNIERVMGKGIAKEIARLFPEALAILKQTKGVLGEVSVCRVAHGAIWNATAQSIQGMGRKTNYEAFYRCFEEIELYSKKSKEGFRLGVPYNIGCGYGGGSWRIIYAILSEIFEESTIKLIVCKKD